MIDTPTFIGSSDCSLPRSWQQVMYSDTHLKFYAEPEVSCMAWLCSPYMTMHKMFKCWCMEEHSCAVVNGAKFQSAKMFAVLCMICMCAWCSFSKRMMSWTKRQPEDLAPVQEDSADDEEKGTATPADLAASGTASPARSHAGDLLSLQLLDSMRLALLASLSFHQHTLAASRKDFVSFLCQGGPLPATALNDSFLKVPLLLGAFSVRPVPPLACL